MLVFRCHPYQTLTLFPLYVFSFFNGPLLNRSPFSPSLPRNIAQTPNVCHSKSDFKPNINQNLDKNLAKIFSRSCQFHFIKKKLPKKEEEKTEQHKTKHRKILSYTLITCSLIGKGLILYSVGIGTLKRILLETIDATPKKGHPLRAMNSNKAYIARNSMRRHRQRNRHQRRHLIMPSLKAFAILGFMLHHLLSLSLALSSFFCFKKFLHISPMLSTAPLHVGVYLLHIHFLLLFFFLLYFISRSLSL